MAAVGGAPARWTAAVLSRAQNARRLKTLALVDLSASCPSYFLRHCPRPRIPPPVRALFLAPCHSLDASLSPCTLRAHWTWGGAAVRGATLIPLRLRLPCPFRHPRLPCPPGAEGQREEEVGDGEEVEMEGEGEGEGEGEEEGEGEGEGEEEEEGEGEEERGGRWWKME
ncbi:unnamed protein product [Closterium sp. Naga37s-1]|nr:unnamed protein product [Closterium sp. Naga37s-1]